MLFLLIVILTLLVIASFFLFFRRHPLSLTKADLPCVSKNKIKAYITLIKNYRKDDDFKKQCRLYPEKRDKLVLLMLLNEYLKQNNNESYDEYVQIKIEQLSKMKFYQSLQQVIANINTTISTAEEREQNNIQFKFPLKRTCHV